MAKCKCCGRKGLFFKVNADSLCSDCAAAVEEDKRLAEVQQREREELEREKSRQELEQKIRTEMHQEMENLKALNQQKAEQTENILTELQPPLPHTSIFKYNDCDIKKESNIEAKDKQLLYAKKYKTSHVQVVSFCCCSECAKYRFRIYSISGRDKRFPKLPDYVKKYSWHCGFMLYPFELGINHMNLIDGTSIVDEYELISYSNRPFIDDRSNEEIERYNRILAKNKQDYIDGINKEQARVEYEQILTNLPDVAPKSQGGYLKMKKSNSAIFQKLKEKAVLAGIEIKDLVN